MRGATCGRQQREHWQQISIHAPREGRDIYVYDGVAGAWVFQSTRPVRGATKTFVELTVTGFISIHAPREGRDK